MDTSKKWEANWIWYREAGYTDQNEMVYFRKKFIIENAESQMKIHVSADSRYRLFVNGSNVGIGPCKGDLDTHYYETFDITSYLRKGENVIAAQVVHFASSGSEHVIGSGAMWRSVKGGFILEGEITDESGNVNDTIRTDEDWKYLQDPSFRMEWESWVTGRWLGGIERVDGRLRPQAWQQLDYNDVPWSNAKITSETESLYGVLNAWPLVPRPIPDMYEEKRFFHHITRTDGIAKKACENTFLQANDKQAGANSTLLLQPRQSYWIELDANELTTGFLRIEMSGGRDSEIRLRCAECYEKESPSGDRIKDVRDLHTDEYKLLGDAEEYIVSGYGDENGSLEVYEPFWFNTFRFVRLEVEVGEEPLRLHHFFYRETGYPLDVQADFQCSDPSFTPLWDVSVRTLKRCMHETYEDCPYYEQYQYLMDTALQMQFTYHISGDDRLARRAIHDFHSSRLPDGMIQCRYPSVNPQVIPGFSLYYIGMLHDHYMYFGDPTLIQMYLPTAEGVINWFRNLINEDGLVGPTPSKYWSYVDWVKDWERGIPAAGFEGPLTVYNLIFATALNQMAVLNEALNRHDTAKEYKQLADRINQAVKVKCWSSDRRMFRDGPETEGYGQQAQLWSVLSGAITGKEAANLMKRTLEDTDIAQVSYAMSFFLFRALSKAEVYDLAFSVWKPWHKMVDLNMTTWAENPNGNRSDCHAWGSVPLYDFPAEILGVKPDQPGYSKIAVRPRIGPLNYAKGSVITPQGTVNVNWKVNHEQLNISIEGPKDIPIRLSLPDGSEREFPTGGSIQHECKVK